jgi:hypothetical protein
VQIVGHSIVASATEMADTVGTPRSPVDVGSVQMNVVTPVTQAALDPLMHTSIITPPVIVSPVTIETPPVVLHTHMSTCSFVVVLFIISYE